MPPHPRPGEAGRGGAGSHHACRQGVHHPHHALRPDQQAGHQRLLRTARRHVAQPCGFGPLGRRHAHRSRHGVHHRQDGTRHSGQYARHHLPLNEGSRVHCACHGLGHVCPSLHASQPGHAPLVWQSHHRTRHGRTGQPPDRQGTHGRTGKHHPPTRNLLCKYRGRPHGENRPHHGRSHVREN